MKIITQPIFTPSFIVFKNLNLNNKEIIKELKKLPYEKIHKSTEKSVSIKILNEIKSGKKIQEEINLCLNVAIKDIWKYDIGHTIVNSWSTKTKPGCESTLHSHKNFWISAVYYPYSERKFKIIFQSDRLDLPSFDINTLEYNCYNSHVWEYTIDTGDVIIFSAALKHKIAMNNTEKTRYSIATNILPKGEIGKDDGTLLI
jgi:ectoine hydroxylase-related dioxygenase (phytanoyl-CoA dioxygenase family)